MNKENVVHYSVNYENIPANFPTHMHEPAFWEGLGRVIATFGFLEEILGRAIFVFTATRCYEENEIEQAYVEWIPRIERALVDPLGGLIDAFGKAVRENQDSTISNLDLLYKI